MPVNNIGRHFNSPVALLVSKEIIILLISIAVVFGSSNLLLVKVIVNVNVDVYLELSNIGDGVFLFAKIVRIWSYCDLHFPAGKILNKDT